ncbi:uncharacterized protein TNCV_3577691 [Trichonephila clavipes]|uniref:Uncharacterized protein n=1 Tax=Trichonephila clavipes TaxID=2585209 RepID=A0A8X6RG50_TRICX|nr:uncharacterized protein TNCV_3577691 [Trichonephila clavipes]
MAGIFPDDRHTAWTPWWVDARQDEVVFRAYESKNILYVEAWQLIVPHLSQTYAQAAKPSTATTTTQIDENITKLVCPPLKLLKSLVSIPKPTMSSKIPVVTKSSTAIQANLLPSTPSVTVT